MGDAALQLKMTPAEYLAFERASDEKHEYVNGEVFAMSGGTSAHALVAANMLGELRTALFDRPCRVFGSDMKIASPDGRYHYPDVSIVCGTPEFEDGQRDVLRNPNLIVEVLSDSTERYDRGDKFASYATIGRVMDYILCSQRQPRIEHFQRQPDGTWIYRALGPGETLSLLSFEIEIAVDRVYHRVLDLASE